MQTSKISFRIVTLILAATLIAACTKETRKARLLGEADNYFKAGNYDKAKLSYLNVLRQDPANALAFERIGAMWLGYDLYFFFTLRRRPLANKRSVLRDDARDSSNKRNESSPRNVQR